MGRIVERSYFQSEFQSHRQSQTVVFTNGCFDILHVGHVRYLQDAKKLGDLLVVGLNSDSSVSQLKGPQRPIQTQQDRAEVLAALSCVDFVCIFSEETPYELIRVVQPNKLVKGGDWKPENIVGSDLVQASGGEVLSLPFHKGRSTTDIVQKIVSLG